MTVLILPLTLVFLDCIGATLLILSSFRDLKLVLSFSFMKRTALSTIAKIFDPLGLISPYVVFGKILLQEVWRLGLAWDDALPLQLQNRYRKWIESIVHSEGWSVSRCYFSDTP